MTDYTHDTAPTQFLEAGGLRFAYRRFGTPAAGTGPDRVLPALHRQPR